MRQSGELDITFPGITPGHYLFMAIKSHNFPPLPHSRFGFFKIKYKAELNLPLLIIQTKLLIQNYDIVF